MSVTETTNADAGISPADFDYLRALVREHTAIELDLGQEYLAETRLAPVARQYELDGIAAVIAAMKAPSAAELRTDVLDAMTTNETSFFRDSHPFEDLTNEIIPGILAARGPADPLVIWCGACSSGQEPYSLAILLNERFPELVQQRRVKILATDYSRTMVKRCAEGRYSQFEVNRGLPAPHLLTYFEQEGRDWVVRQDLRRMITTSELNLLGDWPQVPRADLVLLRNVLIYFSNETKRRILERIAFDVLRPDGYLLLGSSETTLNISDAFETQRFTQGSCYRPRPKGN